MVDDSLSIGVDYSWLTTIKPKYGLVIKPVNSTTLRIDGAYPGSPSDLFEGAWLRIYRDGALVGTPLKVLQSTVSDSWVDVELSGAHNSLPEDSWTIGAIPMEWVSGEDSFGSTLVSKRVHSMDIKAET